MDEAKILNHYSIPSLYPSEWPAEKDDSSSEEEETSDTAKYDRPRSKSRYTILGPRTSFRKLSSTTGSTTSRDVEGLVQKDEPDPLGVLPSVVHKLRQRGLPVEDDTKMRNRFLLSSTTFSPSLFLSQVHSEASTESLLQGLDFLSRSIEKKSASLKVLVESNFDRFVRAKMTIDNVYTEMREQGLESIAPDRPSSRRGSKALSHMRNTSISGSSGRRKPSISSPFSPNTLNKPLTNESRKNALTKESEYGVMGIKGPLIDLGVRADEVWGPALGGREKEEALRAILSSVEKNRGLFEIGPSIQDCIKRKDHDTLVEEYNRARRFADEARTIVETAVKHQIALSDPDVHQVIVTARMWSDVDGQINVFKRDIWRKLAGTHFTKQGTSEEEKPEEHIELIRVLLELGVEDNPIWVWLLSRYDYLKGKIRTTSERAKVEVEILRRHLANGEKLNLRALAAHLISVANHGKPGTQIKTDSPKVLEFWEHVLGSISLLMSKKGGILGEVIEFWETAQSFIEGKAQKKLPIGLDGQSRQHHRLSTDGVRDLQAGAMELIDMLRDHAMSFFSEGPIEDISMLFSPLPISPMTPKSPSVATLSPLSDTRFKFDMNNIPPPSPSRGQSWEKYAFWPPHATAMSGAEYLSKIMAIVGLATSEMANLSLMKDADRTNLKALLGGVRERCVQAVCAAWINDAEHYKILEDWTRSSDRRDLTNLPNRFLGLEGYIISSLQKILYVSDAVSRQGASEVVVPPSAKLLQMVRSQFVASLYKTISGMVENVDKPYKFEDDPWNDDDDEGLAVAARSLALADTTMSSIDPTSRNIRILVTLCNLQSFRTEIVPQLISLFETNFSVSLTEETNQVQSALSQIDSRLFQAYVKPLAEKFSNAIGVGIADKTWPPASVQDLTDARPYVYDILLSLVIVHTEVTTAAAPLTAPILKYLLEQISGALIDAFKKRQAYTLAALMQATLDVEFVAQTLTNYTTDKASETQSAIYLALDERTDNDARMKLQTGLSELRSILKKLRERTKAEFGCFKRPRGQGNKGDRPPSRP